MTVPDQVRDRLKAKLWAIADEIDWCVLGSIEKSQRYENWTHDPDIGGAISHFMDVRQVRVYIKDTLLKKYPQVREADARQPFRILSIPEDIAWVKEYIRPHGRQLTDGRVVCWGRGADWKSVLMATHERAFAEKKAVPYAVVLLQSAGKFGSEEARAVVVSAAAKLGIERSAWDS